MELKNQEALALAKQIVEIIEGGARDPEQLVLKTQRLAALVKAKSDIVQWLRCEMGGYHPNNPVAIKYMSYTNRWIDEAKDKGFWGPLAEVEEQVRILEEEWLHWRTSIRTNLSRSASEQQLREKRGREITNYLTKMRTIRRRIYSMLHILVTNTYHRLLFSGLAESIFSDFKRRTDEKLAAVCGDVLTKFPVIYQRVVEGDSESISHALTSCRRVLDAFADSVYPSAEGVVELGGNPLKVGPPFHQNRINLFIAAHITSDSRRKRLRQGLSNLYDRVSAGVHSDVSGSEARALILETYVFLGELLEFTTVNQGGSNADTLANAE